MPSIASRILPPLLALLCLCQTSAAEFAMSVQVGWDGVYRVGRWTPIYITLADTKALPARNVRLDIIAPHDDSFAMRIRQYLAVRPEPSTFLVYAPLTYQLSDTLAVVRDANTGRSLGEISFDQAAGPNANQRPWYGVDGDQNLIIGVSGRGNPIGLLTGEFQWSDTPPNNPNNPYGNAPAIRIGFLRPQFLPDATVGYNGLDILMLHAPDLTTLPLQHQQAIARWVRAGGRLLFWPGPGAIPPDSPIAALLPCQIGSNTTLSLSLDDTHALGLTSRVDKLAARDLEPSPFATKTPVLLDKAVVCFGRAGLGRAAVLSFDPSQLVFDSTKANPSQLVVDARQNAIKFWRPILRNLITQTTPPDQNNPGQNFPGPESRRLAATETVVDRLGNVPGIGQFDFSYIAIVMIAMMFVVGPIDWFVLKKLGKQPWTWATTIGWITLITVGAIYIGYLFRSGDLYYRTVRLIDQADNQVVAVMDLAGLYSPKTQVYDLDGPRDAWWEPANIDALQPWRRSPRTATEILSAQDPRSNRPQAMLVNIWSLRFMQSELEDPADIPPPIQASLRLGKPGPDGKPRIAGTITNLSSATLTGLIIRTAARHATFPDPVNPGQTVTIDSPLDSAPLIDRSHNQQHYSYSRYGYSGPNPYKTGDAAGFVLATCDLAIRRSQQTESILAQRRDLACIYAQSQDIPPAVKLRHNNRSPAIQQHFQVVRALVELKQVDNND